MLDLEPIKRRLGAITPGPWILAPEKCGPQGQAVYQESSLGPICEVGDPYPRGDNHPQENMEFITSAPTDIATLVAEVERLRNDMLSILEVNGDGSTAGGDGDRGFTGGSGHAVCRNIARRALST